MNRTFFILSIIGAVIVFIIGLAETSQADFAEQYGFGSVVVGAILIGGTWFLNGKNIVPGKKLTYWVLVFTGIFTIANAADANWFTVVLEAICNSYIFYCLFYALLFIIKTKMDAKPNESQTET